MKRRTILRPRATSETPLLSLKRFLLAAALFHLVLTVTVVTLGRNVFLPGTFDTNGTATSIASDGVGHREDTVVLAQTLRSGEFNSWFNSAYPFHVKLYSISFAIFGSLLGFNILAGEPVNLLCYLGILMLVWKLGEEIFDSRAGLVAALVVALWPSFALHTTQLLKDPLFIFGMLALILAMMRLLKGTCSWRKALLNGLVAASITALLWKVRADMGPVLVATVTLGAAALGLRQFQLRRVTAPSLAGMVLNVILTASAILWLPVYRDSDNPRHREREAAKARVINSTEMRPVVRWWQLGAQVSTVRLRFVTMYPEASANIDVNVQFTNTMDLIRYLPRATVIGFFAPFPKMWFETGNSVGSLGRILAGVEMLLMYVIEALAMVGLWRGWRARRGLSVWLLFSIAAIGTIALGLVVANVGTLYRLRYVFLILLIILAARGAAHILDWLTKRQAPMKKGSA